MSNPYDWQSQQQPPQYPQYPGQQPYAQAQGHPQDGYHQYGHQQSEYAASGQPSGYPPPGYLGGPQPPKRNAGLIVGSVTGAVVVIGAVVAILFATGVFGGSGDSAESGMSPVAESRTSSQPSSQTGPSTRSGSAGQSGVRVYDLQPGQCLRNPGKESFTKVELVSCSQPHYAEVFAWSPLSGDSYPGEQKMIQEAKSTCTETASERFADSPIANQVMIQFFVPTQSEWQSGMRKAGCVATGKDGKLLSRPLGG